MNLWESFSLEEGYRFGPYLDAWKGLGFLPLLTVVTLLKPRLQFPETAKEVRGCQI